MNRVDRVVPGKASRLADCVFDGDISRTLGGTEPWLWRVSDEALSELGQTCVTPPRLTQQRRPVRVEAGRRNVRICRRPIVTQSGQPSQRRTSGRAGGLSAFDVTVIAAADVTGSVLTCAARLHRVMGLLVGLDPAAQNGQLILVAPASATLRDADTHPEAEEHGAARPAG